MADTVQKDHGVVSGGGVNSRNWYAWNDLMPPKPNFFHVIGEVEVGNPGIKALLCPAEPQGINPEILILNLILIQQPGIWPQITTWATARYDSIMLDTPYTSVEIKYDGEVISVIQVEDIH